jgi:hypothetical protein
MMDLAYDHHKGLPIVHINLECLVRVRTGALARVSNPVVADVARIEAPQISRNKDVLVSLAERIRIDRHALSCTSGVGERVSVITE